MHHPLTNAARRRRDDDGFVLVYVALLLVGLLVLAAIVIDLGNAREENRQAVAAADAGALAGAQALNPNPVMPGACSAAGSPNDVNCLTAYHTFASARIVPTSAQMTGRGSCTLDTVQSGETCFHYASGKAVVEVKRPYVLPGTGTADLTLIHVKVCWSTPTSFARVIGTNSINVCGSATAKNTPAGPFVPPPHTTDCVAEDNAADPGDSPTIYVFDPGGYPDENKVVTFANGNKTPKNKEDLVAVFDGHTSDVDLNSITFSAPTNSTGPTGGNQSLIRLLPTVDNHGPESPSAKGQKYVVQSLVAPVYAADGTLLSGKVQPYAAGAPYLTVVSYELPDDAHLGGAAGNYVFTADLHVTDSDNGGAIPPTHCGNASWTFNHNGTLSASGGSTCGENSFYGFPPYPSTGKVNVTIDPMVRAYFTDESHLQYKDWTDPTWPQPPSAASDYGIDFTYTKVGDPTIHRITPSTHTGSSAWGLGLTIPTSDDFNSATPAVSGGYWFTDPSPVGFRADHFYTTINWDTSALTDGTYTINLKLFDTDNNKAGNDCGIMTWTIALTGNGVGDIRLVE